MDNETNMWIMIICVGIVLITRYWMYVIALKP